MPRRKDLKVRNLSVLRYRELKYFCLQYPEWKKELLHNRCTYGLKSPILKDVPSGTELVSITEDVALRNIELENNCRLVEQSAIEADSEIYQYILKNVTEQVSYEYLNVPCCRNYFYKAKNKFFQILSNKKK